ncbi:site-specific integrase [Mumia sp. zg.B53]|uniref:tyrosine-type recombinase/integrase n=1 Tax=Mumia sp. zg.B53 TaxID=2855449 RepID=UPI001C6DDD80|nr:site-specific integrase [Mumia sp. zg.B53]MBW9215735.1 site-specific integrase [Mumia sp. zg.B53]
MPTHDTSTSPVTTSMTSPEPHLGEPPASPPRASEPRARPRPRRRPGKRAHGSIRRTGSGRFQVRYTDPTSGKRRNAPQTFETRAEAQDWLAGNRTDIVRGAWRSPEAGAELLGDYLAAWLASRVDLAPRTVDLYEQVAARWLHRPLVGPRTWRGALPITIAHVELRHVSTTLVRDWYAAAVHTARAEAAERAARGNARRRQRSVHAARAWARERGLDVAPTGRLSPAVLAAWRADGSPEPDGAEESLQALHARSAVPTPVTQAYRLLRTVMQAAVREGQVIANPCQIPRAGVHRAPERVPATAEQVARIAAAMPERYAAAVHLAAWSGLRAGELFALARRHVDLETGRVRVERAVLELRGRPSGFGPPKTDASLRTVTLPPHVTAILRAHVEAYTAPGSDALLFTTEAGRILSTPQRTVMFRRACAVVGRDDLRWHDLRHTGATMAAHAGASIREIQARLGHSTVAAAMIYQHATDERDRALAERMTALAQAAGAENVHALPLRRA